MKLEKRHIQEIYFIPQKTGNKFGLYQTFDEIDKLIDEEKYTNICQSLIKDNAKDAFLAVQNMLRNGLDVPSEYYFLINFKKLIEQGKINPKIVEALQFHEKDEKSALDVLGKVCEYIEKKSSENFDLSVNNLGELVSEIEKYNEQYTELENLREADKLTYYKNYERFLIQLEEEKSDK